MDAIERRLVAEYLLWLAFTTQNVALSARYESMQLALDALGIR